jgi:gag-polypeptide of LTR copia-type/Domain of unknown function (DUF4219)
MSSEPSSTSSIGYNVKKLTDHNYRSWTQQMELILDEKELWEVVNDTSSTSAETATGTTRTAELIRKRKRAAALIVSTISSGVLVYLRGEKDPSVMWTTLKDRYAPRTQITRHQILPRFMSLQMKDDDDLQAQLKHVQNIKLELEEQGVDVSDDLFIMVLLSLVTSLYALPVSVLETQEDVTPTTIINCLLEEDRKLNDNGGTARSDHMQIAMLTNRPGKPRTHSKQRWRSLLQNMQIDNAQRR